MPKFELEYYDAEDVKQTMVVEAEHRNAARVQCPSDRVNRITLVDDDAEVTAGQGEAEPTSDEAVQAAAQAAAEAAEPGTNE